MKKLITLTNFNTGNLMHIDSDKIVLIDRVYTSTGSRTSIYLTTGLMVEVKESVEFVLEKLQ